MSMMLAIQTVGGPSSIRSSTRGDPAAMPYVPRREWPQNRSDTRPTGPQLSYMMEDVRRGHTASSPQDQNPRVVRKVIRSTTLPSTNSGITPEQTASQINNQDFSPVNKFTQEYATTFEFHGQTPKSPGNWYKSQAPLNSGSSASPKKKKPKSRKTNGKQRSSSVSSSASSNTEPEIPGTDPVNPSLQKRFHEALLMLSILDKNQGERLDEDELPDLDDNYMDLETMKLRRAFLKSLAYLCDYEKGGSSTTAIALEQRPDTVVYWLASNANSTKINGEICDQALDFLKDILSSLREVSRKNYASKVAKLFNKAVVFSSSRIQKYANWLKGEIEGVLEELKRIDENYEAELVSWLKNIKDATGDPEVICRLCYNTRTSVHYRSLQFHTTDGELCAERFKKIHHWMGRLHHTYKAADTVVFGAFKIGRLLDAFEVRRVECPPSLRPPLEERKPTLFELAGRVVGGNEVEKLRQDLKYLDTHFHIGECLAEKCTRPPGKQIVHAEIILLDHFWRRRLEFVEKDRYIACSKQACYCCRLYIEEHPGEFALPASHNNCYINWRVPDIDVPKDPNDLDHIKAIKAREKILNGMTAKIRIAFIRRVQEQKGPGEYVPDSDSRITSIRARYGGLEELPAVEEELFEGSEITSFSISDGSSIDEENGQRSDSNEVTALHGKFADSETEGEDEENDDSGGVKL
ncbi:hypothetical protein F5884DRAFT_721659 [Xylogone sp. PMI_703]|nr:hypothetical protein F5884DRAFT_721659 [Xylogone sp. PMI_703]